MKDKKNIIELLKKISLFKELTEEEIKEIVNIGWEIKLKKGQVLFKEGDKGNAMYIIYKGKVAVVKRGEKLVSLKRGNFFGEMALIEDKPRSADIVAETDTTLFEINKKNFEKFLSQNPAVTLRMMKILSQRLRETDVTLISNLKKKNIELQKAYEDLKKMQEELLKRERLSSIGMLTSRIVHDLKNPVAGIKSCIELILLKAEQSKEIKELCKMIEEETDYILSLVLDLLDLSKGQIKIKLEPVDIDNLIKLCIEEHRSSIKQKKIKEEIRLKFNKTIIGDRKRLKRCFSNIIANAIDAMNEGGTLTITTRQYNKRVVIRIKDTGKGIPQEIIDKIFEPFFTKGKERGTGLGMAIAKSVIDAHKGEIQINSKLGAGTEIKILLPLSLKSAGNNT